MKQTQKVLAVAVAAVALAASPPGRQGGDEPLKVSVIRFYQPARATTTIEGVCEVRLGSLQRPGTRVSGYRVDVTVEDTAGLVLQHSDQAREMPAQLEGDVTALESFAFNAAPGRYRVRVRVVPSEGEALERSVEVTAYGRAPAISDLLLANHVRRPASDSDAPQPGEIRRVGLLMRTAPIPRLTPVSSQLSWYAEIYTGAQDTSGELVGEVIGADGRAIVATPPRTVTLPAGGGLTRGSLDLAGLPAGDYRLRLRLALGDSIVVTEAPFAMAPVTSMATVAQAEQAAAAARPATNPADPFEAASVEQLDSLEGPLVYVARNPRDLGLYRTLTTEGKRRFLREFWNNPSTRVDGSVGRVEFYRAVAFVNEAFKESGSAAMPGWNTDRGRVFLKNGRWDELLKRPSASVPYEVWKYTQGRARWFIFADQTGVGHYTLLVTNDSRENGSRQSGWEGFLGPDATRDTYAFLGMDLRNFGIR